MRYGKMESVVVVARNGDQVIYYEDVEDGFNVSPLSQDGQVLEHLCNQDELPFVLNAWIDGRGLPGRFGPAVPLNEIAWLRQQSAMWDSSETISKELRQERRLLWAGRRDISKNYSEIRQYSFGHAATAWQERLTLVSW